MKKNNFRIKDIAQLAGVSIGTVDRVLHKRGKVSEEALQKVLGALQEIDYKPNLIARTLSTKKIIRVVVIIPDPTLDEYWSQSNLGITQAITDWQQYDIQVESCFFNLYDKNSFFKITEKTYATKPNGIVIAPIFYQEALFFLKKCENSSIPVVIFNNNIPEVRSLCFIGQNLYESGKVAAELIHLSQPNPGTFAVLHIDEDSSNSVHLADKQKGFEEYIKRNPDYNILAINLNSKNEAVTAKQINNLLADKQLRGIFVTTSKGISMIASYLEKHHRKDIRLVGYDLLKENIDYLQSGTITFLINQNSKHQTVLGISHLANYLFMKKLPPESKLLPLEIISRENLNSYLNQ